MDEYKGNSCQIDLRMLNTFSDFYYGTRPNAKGIPPGDLSIRHHFKKINQCKGFDWYIKNVYPRQHIPERNSVSWGHAKRGEHCLTTFAKKNTYGRLGASTCNQGLYNPNWQDMDKQSLVIKKDSNLFQQPVKMEDGSYKNMCFGSNDQPPKSKLKYPIYFYAYIDRYYSRHYRMKCFNK